MVDKKRFYRYHDYDYSVGVKVELSEYIELRETPSGYWIISKSIENYRRKETIERLKRWISKTSAKRYAYPTKLEAINNLIHRKRRQIDHSEYFANRARSAKYLAEEMRVKIETGSV